MRWFKRWIIGGHREIERPRNVVSDELMRRIEQKRDELERRGVVPKAVRRDPLDARKTL
jgi:hypothetical protein